MTNQTIKANGRTRVVMAGALQDQIDQLNELAETALNEACEYQAQQGRAQSAELRESAKRGELYHMGKRCGYLLAVDNLRALLAVSIAGANRDAERKEADRAAGMLS